MHTRIMSGRGIFAAIWVLAVGCLVAGGSGSGNRAWADTPPGGAAGGAVVPRIQSVERRGAGVVVRATVPPGTVRLVLESCQRGDLRGWMPRAVERPGAGSLEVTFELVLTSGMELFRVRADATEPLPATYYTGRTNYPGETVADGLALRNTDGPPTEDAGVGGGEAARSVVESDIWVIRGEMLYFFNQYRGLQVIDLSLPDAPRLVSTFPLPGAGEQMYLLDDRHAVLLAHDPCRQWGTDAESAMIVVDTGVQPPVERARLPMKGRVVESRLVGTALYVATESWQPAADASGAWQSGTHVASFDLADPTAPVARKPLWFPGSGNVVTATDRFLFVAITDYSQNWPWRSDLQVVDVSAADGLIAPVTLIPLAGHVADKFKIDLLDDVLRVVVEAPESPSNGRFVTVLETIRLADPRSAGPVAYVRLDRLELARGERLFATRFDGNRAYVVTYLRIDPLWVVDLSDPADVKVAGELHIPGWSTYIRPLGDRLLTMGIDDTRGWRVAVQLFDVSDPARPTLLSKVPLGEDSSWSEANQDEKALGVVEDAGLLLVPVSEWNGTGSRTGVQLIDLGRDTLTRRGLLESPDLVPRRATYHRDRVLTVSGRRMVTADVRDRDRPQPAGSVELSYPVERVVVADKHLFEFASGRLRVTLLESETEPQGSEELGDLPVLGAAWRGGRLHVLQGRAAEVTWDYADATKEYVARTNAGVLVHTVWNGAVPPKLERLGEAKAPTSRTWLSEATLLELGDGQLVWAGMGGSRYPWLAMRGGAVEDMAVTAGGIAGRGMGLWWPGWGWGGSGRLLVGVRLAADGRPERMLQTELGGSDQPVGAAQAAGRLVFSTRQKYLSEVTGTNLVVESAWYPLPAGMVTNVVAGEDGSRKTNIVAGREGEWRPVTNAYPVVRWWSKHDLDVVDYPVDLPEPLVRPGVEVSGPLVGVARDGALLHFTASRTDAKGNVSTWLEAGAYDGVAVHQVDAVMLADQAASESVVVVGSGPDVFAARGGWAEQAVNRMEAWRLSDAGRWERRATVSLAGPPGEIARVGDVLLANGGGALDLIRIDGAGQLLPLPVARQPGCLGSGLDRADGDSTRGVWLPLWDYGVVRLGP